MLHFVPVLKGFVVGFDHKTKVPFPDKSTFIIQK